VCTLCCTAFVPFVLAEFNFQCCGDSFPIHRMVVLPVLSVCTHTDILIKECDKHAKTVAMCFISRFINFQVYIITCDLKLYVWML